MGRSNTTNRPTLWTKHTDYLTVNGVPGELSKDTISKKTLTNRKYSDDLIRIEASYIRDMKTLTSDKRAMENSMLIYSEKMKRISRDRMPISSASPPIARNDAFPKEKWPSCTKLDDISDKNISTNPKGSQSSPRIRSYSDASSYSHLRGNYISNSRKKISLDMTNKGGSELTTLTPSPDGAETSDSGIESPKLGNVRQRRHGVAKGPKLNCPIPEMYTSDESSASDKSKLRRLPLLQNFQSGGEQDVSSLGNITKHSLDFESISDKNDVDISDCDRLFKIYGKRWNKHPRTDSDVLFGKARDSKQKLKSLIRRSESLGEYDMSRLKGLSNRAADWQPTRQKYQYSSSDHSDTFQAAMQCMSLSDAEMSRIGNGSEICDTGSNFSRKIRDMSSDELQLLVAKRDRKASRSSSSSSTESSDSEEDIDTESHSPFVIYQPLKSVLKKLDSTQDIKPEPQQRKCVTFQAPDRIRLIYREPEEDISEPSNRTSSQSEATIVIVSQ